MSSGTNQERIEQNNLKLAQLKTKADNLPEYQDIEPIYKSVDYNLINTQYSFPYSNNENYWQLRDCLGDYIYYMNYRFNPYIHYIGRIKEDNTVEVLWSMSYGSGGSSYYYKLIDYDDDYLYYKFCNNSYTNTVTIRRFNLNTKTMETGDYWTFSVAHKQYNSYCTVLKRGYIFTNHIIYRLDCKNKEYEVVTDLYNFTQVQEGFTILYNQFIGSQQGTDSTKRVLFRYDAPGIYKVYDVSTNKINTIVNDSKIIINNNMYELNDDLSQGNLVKENVIEDYVDNECLIQIASNYFIETTINSLTRRLYYYDETTKTFSLVTSVSNKNSSTPGGSNKYLTAKFYSANSTLLGMIKFDVSSELIGYVLNGYTFSINSATILKNDKVLEGNIVYNVKGDTVSGTMPNNGALNYTPSTSQQTIPAGYTSGGTIGAVTSSIDSNIQAENIKNGVTILGVEGTYEGSSDFNAKMLTSIADTTADLSKYIVNIPVLDTSNIRNMNSTFYGCSALAEVPLLNTSNVTTMNGTFYGCSLLTSIPLFITSNVTSMSNIFKNCTSLVDVPVFDTSALINMTNMFSSCPNLSNNSLNNILTMCINASSFNGVKTLKTLGLTSAQATICQSLENYQDFVDAGWTTGY